MAKFQKRVMGGEESDLQGLEDVFTEEVIKKAI